MSPEILPEPWSPAPRSRCRGCARSSPGSFAFFLGTAGHVMADGLLPGTAFLVVLFGFLVLIGLPVLARPASRVRMLGLLVGGQTFIHLCLTLTAGHRGDPRTPTATLPANTGISPAAGRRRSPGRLVPGRLRRHRQPTRDHTDVAHPPPRRGPVRARADDGGPPGCGGARRPVAGVRRAVLLRGARADRPAPAGPGPTGAGGRRTRRPAHLPRRRRGAAHPASRRSLRLPARPTSPRRLIRPVPHPPGPRAGSPAFLHLLEESSHDPARGARARPRTTRPTPSAGNQSAGSAPSGAGTSSPASWSSRSCCCWRRPG